MADDTNEDSWLYGTSNPDSTTNEEERANENISNEAGNEKVNSKDLVKAENEALAAVTQGDGVSNLDEKGDDAPGDELVEFEDPAHEMEEDEEATAGATVADTTDADENAEIKLKEHSADDEDVEEDEDDESDDDINVVIGDIKAAPSTYNINKRSNLLAGANSQEKSKSTQAGKFSIEDFEGVGSINGVTAHEFSIDSLEDKPWRKPGADITDYFNYGFNEETWRSYCERQKRFRVAESGIGLASLTQNLNPQLERQSDSNMLTGAPPGILPGGPMPIGPLGDQIQMPPPGMMQSSGMHQGSHQGMPSRFASMPRGPRPVIQPGTKENAIQVMTAECREYSRPGQMPPNFVGQGPGEEAFFHEPEPFDYGYEPTQDSQWGNDNVNWAPSGIKELTPGPNSGPPQQLAGPPGILPTPMGGPPQMGGPPPQMRHPHPQPPMMSGMPPPNIGMGPPMGMMMGPSGPGGPPMHMPMGPPRMIAPNGPHDRSDDERERRRRERDWERDRDRERGRRERSRSREKSRRRSKSRDKERDKERDKDREKERDRERERDRDRERSEKVEDTDRSDEERERRRRDRDRERERERDRERSRRDRSRSREKSRRRSKSRDKERERSSKTGASSSSSSSSRSEKKKGHRKEDEE